MSSSRTLVKFLYSAFFLSYLLQLTKVSAKPVVGFTASSSNETETSGLISIALQRTNQTNSETIVSVTLSGSATKDADYIVSGSLRVTFPADDLSNKTQTINLFIVNDQEVESGSPETIVLTIQEGPLYNINTWPSHTVNISDDDVNITCQNADVKESDGTANVTISRSGSTQALNNDHSIGYFTKDDSAVAPSDYTTENSVISFTNSSQEDRVMRISIADDKIPEANETFKVRCYSSDVRVNIQSSCKDATVTIQNDDTYVFLCPGYQTLIRENAGPYTVRLCRVGVLYIPHTIQLCRTSDGGNFPSVTAGCDNVTFGSAADAQTANIAINNDTKGEQELKTFQIYLQSNDSNVTINDTARYDVTLQDDDNTFYLTDVSELRLNESTPEVNVTVTINRVGETSAPSKVSLELNFTQSTAESLDCSGSSPREIDFSANETSKTVTACTVVDDRLIEDDETFVVQISGIVPSNVNTSASQRTIKLISNDVNVTCRGVSLKEADGPAVVRLNRTGATAITANDVMCFTADGTALSSNDYQARTPATVSFALNVLQKDLNVNLTNDRIVETNESFTVTCNSSDPRVVVDSSCSDIQINIINDDTYVFFCSGYKTLIRENAGPYTVRLCRVGVLEDTHTVQLCRTSDSVSLPHDYPSVEERCDNITFAAYDEIKEHNINVSDDTWGEQEFKIFTISINTTDPGVEFNDTTSYNVTVHDNDNSFCFTNTSLKVYEEYDGYAILTIIRTGAISVSNATVTINTSPQTATTPEDYYPDPIINQPLTFLVGEIEKNVSIKIVNDKLVEDDQTFQLSLSGANGSTVFPNCMRSTVTIVSNDVNIFCEDRRGFQSVYEKKSPVLMDFKREGSLQYNHTIRIRTIPGTAQPEKDYIAIDKTLTFPPHQTNMKENVTFINDNDVEPDETFRLSVTSTDDRVHMICPGTRFTILNDDTFIRCANRSIDVSEGNKTVYFTLKREGVLDKSSRIWFTTKDGTAFDKADYKPRNQVNETFLPGQVYMTLSVDIVDDEYKEDDEAFSVIIGSYVQTTLTSGDKCTNITIKDDDPNRMTEQQAQELLARRRNFLIIIGVAVAFMALVVMLFIGCVCHILHRFKK